MKVKVGVDKDNKAYVEFSGDAPAFWYQPIEGRRMSLSDFRRALGYSDVEFDEHTAAFQSYLRANVPHDPTQSANIGHPQARVESHITPGEPQCYQVVPHLLRLGTIGHPKIFLGLHSTFEMDHSGRFLIYKVASTGKWSLLHALVASLTILHPSTRFSVLDLYYHYKKAAANRANAAAHNSIFNWHIADQAIVDYMKDLGLPTRLTFVVVRPLDDKATFTCPRNTPDWAVTMLQRLWLMYTKNEDPHRSHFNVVMRHDTEMSPILVNALNELESQQNWEYGGRIGLLEADLMDRNVSMTSLTLEETRELFHETPAARSEHMNRADFMSSKASPAAEESCLESDQSA